MLNELMILTRRVVNTEPEDVEYIFLRKGCQIGALPQKYNYHLQPLKR